MSTPDLAVSVQARLRQARKQVLVAQPDSNHIVGTVYPEYRQSGFVKFTRKIRVDRRVEIRKIDLGRGTYTERVASNHIVKTVHHPALALSYQFSRTLHIHRGGLLQAIRMMHQVTGRQHHHGSKLFRRFAYGGIQQADRRADTVANKHDLFMPF